jgi:hypothetical protein
LVSCRMNTLGQGCQMVWFQTKDPNLGKFWRVLLWKILVFFMTIWSILRPFEIFYGHFIYFVVIWYIFPCFGILDQEKSGNPALGLSFLYKKLPTQVYQEPILRSRVATSAV